MSYPQRRQEMAKVAFMIPIQRIRVHANIVCLLKAQPRPLNFPSARFRGRLASYCCQGSSVVRKLRASASVSTLVSGIAMRPRISLGPVRVPFHDGPILPYACAWAAG